MSEIRAIETWYNGYRFRSRLEARWAVFLDALGVKYEYEPEGFVLSDGSKYLPDFRVKCWGCREFCPDEKPVDLYIEVKGFMSEGDARRINAFAAAGNRVLVVNMIPPHGKAFDGWALGSEDNMDGTDISPFNFYLIDGDFYGAFPAADKSGRFYLVGGDYRRFDDDERRVEYAYTQARIARFEWGETPEPDEVRKVVNQLDRVWAINNAHRIK